MVEKGPENISKQYPDHWLESIIWQIEERKVKQVNLSTGKTPSGHVHLGILRELLICDALRRIFENKKTPVKYRMFLDSLDAAKRFPSYISEEYNMKYIGQPFAFIPNPFKNDNRHFAQVFGEELVSTFEELGIKVDVIWTHELYKTPEMQELIRIALKKNDEIKQIIANFLTSTMTDEERDDFDKQQENWMGAMVICEKCGSTQKKQKDGSISANRVISYDEKTDEVTYICPKCQYNGRITISSGLVKLNWRLDWPAKWKLFQTTCEPAGKDHCTPGGSYDTGLALSKRIYDYIGPIKVPYEWLRLGDTDMKTSKGIVFTPRHFLDMAEPEIIRMLILLTNPNKHISFRVEEIPQYYNELERIEKIYFGLENAANPEEEREIKFAFPLIFAQVPPKQFTQKLSFKFLTILAQLQTLLGNEGIYKKAIEFMNREKFEEMLSEPVLLKKVERVGNWLKELQEMIANENDPAIIKKLKSKADIFSIPEKVSEEMKKTLDPKQKKALIVFLEKIKPLDSLTEENTKGIMMEIQKELDLKPAQLFAAFYTILIGSKQGPRLGPLLSMLEKSWIEQRFKQAL